MDELAFLPALEQAALVRAGEVTPEELVSLYLRRIEAVDPGVNAFVTVCGDEALDAARGELPDGPFRGVPLPVKDLTETAGIRTTFSCRAFAGNVPKSDVEIVRRMRAAGFVLIGKTNTPEFGTTAVTESDLNGICRNPWDAQRTPGGSSGGAAAAVAAGLAPIAHGSDGGGSIRIPAACCGLFGLKVSRGRNTPAPYGDLYGLSVHGSLARTVADSAAFIDAIAGPAPGDPYIAPTPARPFAEEVGAPPGRLRVALVLDPPHAVAVEAPCRDAAVAAGALLASLGHEVEEAAQPRTDELLDLFGVVWQTIPALHGVKDLALLEPMNRAFAERAAATPAPEYLLALAALQGYGRRFAEFCAGYDLVLTPALARLPVPVGWVRELDDPWEQYRRAGDFTPFTPPVNVAGLPAAAVPFTWTDDGIPVGVHLIGRYGDEATLLRVSAQIEAAQPWADRRPPLAA